MSDPITALPPTAADGVNDRAGWLNEAGRRLGDHVRQHADVVARMQAGIDSKEWPAFSNAAAFLEGVRWALVAYGRTDCDWLHALVNGAGMAVQSYGDPLAAPHVPTPTPESVMSITDRLRGMYRIPITDGLGPVAGENLEPGNALEYVRQVWTAPIQHEAAAVIDALRDEVVSVRGALQRLGVPDGRTRFVVVTTELVDELKRRPSVPVTISIDERDHGELSFVLRYYQPTPVLDADVVTALLDVQQWDHDDTVLRAYAERAVALAHSNTRGLRRALEGFARRHPNVATMDGCPYPSDDVCDAIMAAVGGVDLDSQTLNDVRAAIRGAFVIKPVGG